MNCALKKLKSRRGSGIAEALVGFLISVLSVLILFGIISTTGDLIREGDANLQKFYSEEKALDLYNIAGAAGFQAQPTLYGDDGQLRISYNVGGGSTENYKINIKGDPKHGPDDANFDTNANSDTLEGAYFVTSKFHMFAFSTD